MDNLNDEDRQTLRKIAFANLKGEFPMLWNTKVGPLIAAGLIEPEPTHGKGYSQGLAITLKGIELLEGEN